LRQVLIIAGREWRAFCGSAQAPVITAAFLVLSGLFYYLLVSTYADVSLATIRSGRPAFLNLHVGIFHKLYGYMVLFLVFLLPAVTMRLMSAEYRSGRYDLITSWPVGELRWILGKWLSAVLVAKILLLATVFYFLLTMALGYLTDPPTAPTWQPLLTALIGLSLLSGAVAAWGLLASTLFNHQAAAYFVGFAVALSLFMAGQFAPHLPGVLAPIAAEIALGEHFIRFAGGIIDSRDVVYYLGLTAVGLAASAAVLTCRRLPPGRRARPWMAVLAVLAAAVFLQAVAVRRPLRVDLTPDRLYSLAPQTERILEVMDRARPDPQGGGTLPPAPVEAVAFYQNIDGARQNIQALLQAIADRSTRFRFRMIDPNYEPDMVHEYGVTVGRTVVLTCEDRQRHLLEPDEWQIASALYRLVTDTRPVVYWMLGHGEIRLDVEDTGGGSRLSEMLGSAGYALRPLVLPERLYLPPDADLVIWAGPKLDPSEATLELLVDYLTGGGSMACFFGPDTPEALREWTERFNVQQMDDVVVAPSRESAMAGVGLRTVTVVEGYGEHPTVSRMMGVATTFHLVQTLNPMVAEMPGIEGRILLWTGSDTWGETDHDTRYGGQPRYDPEVDHAGPRPFAVAMTVAGDFEERIEQAAAKEAAPGRLVIVGNNTILNNANIGLYGNRDLILNFFGWLVADEDLLDIRGRRFSFQPLLLDAGPKRWLGWTAVLIWPGLIGLTWLGAVIRRQRRH
jgi:ABC-type transport system involved in multi-copper enzyme maturation permease subunit/ABC-type uncharacterized transport system involved in gliding motility auxiliary subunit